MSKFVYKYDTILRVKEILEKKILKEISEIEREIEKLEKEKILLVTKRKNLADKISIGKIKVNDYKSAKAAIKTIERLIVSIEKKIEEWKEKKQKKLDELLEKKKERKIFETLKEKMYEDYLIEDNRNDLKQLNEIAINNFNRKEQ